MFENYEVEEEKCISLRLLENENSPIYGRLWKRMEVYVLYTGALFNLVQLLYSIVFRACVWTHNPRLYEYIQMAKYIVSSYPLLFIIRLIHDLVQISK